MANIAGVKKCSKSNISYFSVHNVNESISFDKDFTSLYSLHAEIQMESIELQNGLIDEKKTIWILAKLNYNLIFTANNGQSTHLINKTVPQMFTIRFPDYLRGLSAKQILGSGRLKAQLFIEDIHVEEFDSSFLLINFVILADVAVTPGYSLAFAFENQPEGSQIFFSYENGSMMTPRIITEQKALSALAWCPVKNEVAFLRDGALCTLATNGDEPVSLVPESVVQNITAFAYMCSEDMLFSGYSGGTQQLFQLHTGSRRLKQLTHFTQEFRSFKKISYCRKNNTFYLLSTQNGRRKIERFAPEPHLIETVLEADQIRTFSIHPSGERLLAATAADEVLLIDLSNGRQRKLPGLSGKTVNSLVFMANRGDLAIFCANHAERDDLFIYDFELEHMRNLTSHESKLVISDFLYDTEGARLLYACNYHERMEVYEINILSNERRRLVDCAGDSILLAVKGGEFYE